MITPDRAHDMLHYSGHDGFTAPELCLTAELVAHAPVMAEQIANMHFRYAVQITDVTGKTRFAKGLRGATLDIESALWTPEPHDSLADYWRGNSNVEEVRIVRRLMSDPEVIE